MRRGRRRVRAEGGNSMSEPTVPLTPEKRKELVLDAIDRIHAARARYREVQMDPYADSDDRGAARDAMDAIEREFAWQFENVEFLLRAAPEGMKPVTQTITEIGKGNCFAACLASLLH